MQEAQAAASRVVRETNRASGVIQRILALLRKSQPQWKPLDGNEVIREVLLLMANELQKCAITVKTELAEDIPRVESDRVLWQQVLLNLIMNAIEAMGDVNDRPRELTIRSSMHPEGVLIQVQDTGHGLDRKSLDHIFHPFFTTKPGGIGLGLSISQSIVESNGGRLWATAGPSHGAIFQFTLPLRGVA